MLATAAFNVILLALPADVVELRIGDLLVGGDGCGAGATGGGVNPRTGKAVNPGVFGGSGSVGAVFHATDGASGKANLPAIDGVFVVDGNSRVDSNATTFPFPDTDGAHWDALRNGLALVESGNIDVPLQLADQPGVDRHGVGMHANAGFTVDLDAVRAAWPGAKIERASGVAGVTTDTQFNGDVTVFVLVDAAQKWTGSTAVNGFAPFSVDLAPTDKLLTFACTDFDGSNGSDHGAIADLVLELSGLPDCNQNLTPDSCDIGHGASTDCNANTIPDECEGGFSSYGQGCPGAGGHVPVLGAEGCAVPGGQLVLSVTGHTGGAPVLLLFGVSPADLPMGADCSLLVQPLLPVSVELPSGGTGPGQGLVILGATLPAAAPPQFTMQAFVPDYGGALGFANSNGLLVVLV